MEVLALASLGYLGHYMSSFDSKKGPNNSNVEPDHHIYSSNRVQKYKKKIQNIANDRYQKSKRPIETFIIPNNYNSNTQEWQINEQKRIQETKHSNYTKSLEQYNAKYQFSPVIPEPTVSDESSLLPPPQMAQGMTSSSTDQVHGFMSLTSDISSFNMDAPGDVPQGVGHNNMMPNYGSHTNNVNKNKFRALDLFTGNLERTPRVEQVGNAPIKTRFEGSSGLAYQEARNHIRPSDKRNDMTVVEKHHPEKPLDSRIRIKPKNLSTGQGLPGRSNHGKGMNRSSMKPNFEKRTPETSFFQNPSQWFIQKVSGFSGNTMRGRIEKREGQRASTSEIQYTGNPNSKALAGMTGRSKVAPSVRTEKEIDYVGTPYQDGGATSSLDSYYLPTTSREVHQIDAQGTANVSTTFNQSQMQMQDDVPVTQRQFTNIDSEEYGVMGRSQGQGMSFNPNDMLLDPTLREQLIQDAEARNVSSTSAGNIAYDPYQYTPSTTIRQTTGSIELNANLQGRSGATTNNMEMLPTTSRELLHHPSEIIGVRNNNQTYSYNPNDWKTEPTLRDMTSTNLQGGINTAPKHMVYDKEGLVPDITNREMTQTTIEGFIGQTIKEMPTYDPKDIPDPTIRDQTSTQFEPYINNTVSNGVVYNPNDIPDATIRQQTSTSLEGNIMGTAGMTTYDPYDRPGVTIRDQTTTSLEGNIGSLPGSSITYDPYDRPGATIRDQTTTSLEGNIGNLPGSSATYDPLDVPDPTIRQQTSTQLEGTLSAHERMSLTYDPNDRPKPTIKQLTSTELTGSEVHSINRGRSYDPNDVPDPTVRDVTSQPVIGRDYTAPTNKSIAYDPNDKPMPTVRDMTRMPMVGKEVSSHVSKSLVYDPNDIARITNKQTTIYDSSHSGAVSSGRATQGTIKNMTAPSTQRQTFNYNDMQAPHQATSGAYQTNIVHAPATQRQSISNKSVINHAKGQTHHRDYQDIENMELREDMEAKLEHREPTQTSVKIPNGANSMNMELAEPLPEKEEYVPSGGVFRQPPIRHCKIDS